ncbi:MAG: hypothetical protein JST22_10090 [Bacteroidetes bacterium]|nr:hypothetical protein [Bacteroidota bacterium]
MLNLSADAQPAFTFTTRLTKLVSIVTKVYGSALNMAVVEINIGDVVVWAVQLTQIAPFATIPQEIVYHGVVIGPNTSLMLIIPWGYQQGSISLSTVITDPPEPPQAFSFQICHWTLEQSAQSV